MATKSGLNENANIEWMFQLNDLYVYRFEAGPSYVRELCLKLQLGLKKHIFKFANFSLD